MEICADEPYDHLNKSFRSLLPSKASSSMISFLLILATTATLGGWALYRAFRNAPVGYEDDTGFRYGIEEAPVASVAWASTQTTFERQTKSTAPRAVKAMVSSQTPVEV